MSGNNKGMEKVKLLDGMQHYVDAFLLDSLFHPCPDEICCRVANNMPGVVQQMHQRH